MKGEWAVRPRAATFWLAGVAVGAILTLLPEVLRGSLEWRPVALCIIGTATASAVVLWFVPPGINAWRSGYLAGLRDAGLVEDDEPGRDHLHIVR